MFIPISEDCYSTFKTIKMNKRNVSTLFDWIVISPKRVLSLFKENFYQILEQNNLTSFDNKVNNKFKHKKLIVVDTKYNFVLPHHFDDIKLDYIHIKETFDMRIKRMINIIRQEKKVTFVYKELKYKNWIDFLPKDEQSFYGISEMRKLENDFITLFKEKYDCFLNFLYV